MWEEKRWKNFGQKGCSGALFKIYGQCYIRAETVV